MRGEIQRTCGKSHGQQTYVISFLLSSFLRLLQRSGRVRQVAWSKVSFFCSLQRDVWDGSDFLVTTLVSNNVRSTTLLSSLMHRATRNFNIPPLPGRPRAFEHLMTRANLLSDLSVKFPSSRTIVVGSNRYDLRSLIYTLWFSYVP